MRSNKFLQYGLPMVIFVVAGYVGLTKFVEGKVDMMDSRVKKRSERAVEMEMYHKAIVGRLNLADLELKPVPKPPSLEEDDEEQEEGAAATAVAPPAPRAGSGSGAPPPAKLS